MMEPVIIQGGMGIGISNWRLARAVSKTGQLGVVSGTALASLFVRRLQDGDKDHKLRHAMSFFPQKEIVEKILRSYFIEGGRSIDQGYRRLPMYTLRPNKNLDVLTVVANFVEVFLAKEGHKGIVGLNLLEKIQLPTLASLYGAMLAGVDYVLMGAGIPREIPGVLDLFTNHLPASLRLDVTGADAGSYKVEWNPKELGLEGRLKELKRPRFLPIVSSTVLARSLLARSTGPIDGFVIETAKAGGHNAAPRGRPQLSALGEPIYGPKDEIDFKEMRKIERPFWLAGGFGTPQGLQRALSEGAAGIQLGTMFAFCEESGLKDDLKQQVLEQSRYRVDLDTLVYTDPLASPTGMPFKVVELKESLSDDKVYNERPRRCDLGYLREIYVRPDGRVGFRCPGEPIKAYVEKGGLRETTQSKKCLCNALMATAGYPQIQSDGYFEQPLVTSGSQLSDISQIPTGSQKKFSAAQVIEWLKSPND